ncbi:hypothetical protein [Nocardia exalbida]|uniref:hypothetical protein n=1 Tax=Nocardia exalbida TaxID=290231 RepID=UPI0012F703B9|nr:hypothetical protein [Nocardia exalbida]
MNAQRADAASARCHLLSARDWHLRASTYLLTDRRLRPAVGIWGADMGGTLAALVGATDEGIAACCVNSRTTRPVEGLDGGPRVVTAVIAMLGLHDPAEAHSALEPFTLTQDLLGDPLCPLLVLHARRTASSPSRTHVPFSRERRVLTRDSVRGPMVLTACSNTLTR